MKTKNYENSDKNYNQKKYIYELMRERQNFD